MQAFLLSDSEMQNAGSDFEQQTCPQFLQLENCDFWKASEQIRNRAGGKVDADLNGFVLGQCE